MEELNEVDFAEQKRNQEKMNRERFVLAPVLEILDANQLQLMNFEQYVRVKRKELEKMEAHLGKLRDQVTALREAAEIVGKS